MQLLSNMKLSRMIMVVALLPLLAMIFFSVQNILKEIDRSHAMADLEHLAALAVKTSSLVHEQQKERGMTAGFLSSSGTKFVAELSAQRQLTNNLRAELDTFLSGFDAENYGSEFDADLKALLTTLGQMAGIREQVDSQSISLPKAIGYFTALNGQSLKLIELMGRLSPDATIFSRIVGYTNFLQGKERAGIERAVGASQFAAGKFATKQLDKFKRLITVQDTYNTVFLTQATDEQKALFNDVMSSEAAKQVEHMRKTAIAGGSDGNLEGITGEMWFKTITKKINGLKRIEDSLSQNLSDQLSQLRAAAESNKWFAISMALIALVLVVGLSWLVIRSINVSFRTITSSMTKLAEGNLAIELPPATNNEIGKMVECVMVFKDNAIEKVELEKQQAESAKRAEEEKRTMMNKLADDFDANVGGIIETVSSAAAELNSTAQSMAGISEETSSRAAAVASASEEASANVQTVASATEEMATSINEINGQVVQASEASNSAVQIVDTTNVQINNLAETANKIGEVVKMISDIAEQTNLLALNATIESARAGEAGKGFAVVAGEVKALASQTARATDEISQQIGEIQTSTSSTVKSMEDIAKVIGQLDEVSTTIAAAMDEQGATTREISRSVHEAATGANEVTKNITGVTQVAQETGSASTQVTSAAGELSQQAEMLKTEVGKILNQIRAA